MPARVSRDHIDRGDRQRKLSEQHVPFVGLFLSPFAGLLLAWLIHAYVQGVSLDWGPISWHLSGSSAALVVVSCLISVGAIGLGVSGYHFADHRKPFLRWNLAVSAALLTFLFAISIGVGPHRWWSFGFVLFAWYVAGVWSMARLRVTRNDKRESDGEEKETILDKLGWKGFGFKVREQVLDPESGELERTEIDVTHAPGETVERVQAGVPGAESYVGAPPGMSRAVRDPNHAGRSTLTFVHRDILDRRAPYGPPSFPGGSISDPLIFARYDTGHPVWCHIGGGPGFPPSGYGFMGMTRTGKTWGENQMLTELITRRDVVILYINQAKGAQDVAPIIAGVEATVIASGDAASDAGVGEYKAGLEMVKRIITYRQAQLARFGEQAWHPGCFSSPPTRRRSDGTIEKMEPMPALVVHVGEADSILERAGDLGIYVASKGLSCGVIAGWSLQRASAESMPTGLRFNVGTWWVFGCGDEYSAGFALTDSVLKAGAHPEEWKQRKPGYHYFYGMGIDESLFPVPARTNSGESQEDLLIRMSRRCMDFAPQMARLDRGSANATGAPGEPGNRWDLLVEQTDRLRQIYLGGEDANVTASDRNPGPQTQPAGPATFTVGDNVAGEDADTLTATAEFDDEVRSVTEVEGVELYPQFSDDPSAGRDDLPAPPDPADDLVFDEGKPAAASRGEAVRALHAALRQLMADPDFRDPADPTGSTAIIQVDDIYSRFPYRSRPWFSGELTKMANGEQTPPPALSLERHPDFPPTAAKYRLKRVGDDPAE